MSLLDHPEAKAILAANEHMRGVNDNWNESVKAIRLEVDQSKARALGVSSQSVPSCRTSMWCCCSAACQRLC